MVNRVFAGKTGGAEILFGKRHSIQHPLKAQVFQGVRADKVAHPGDVMP